MRIESVSERFLDQAHMTKVVLSRSLGHDQVMSCASGEHCALTE